MENNPYEKIGHWYDEEFDDRWSLSSLIEASSIANAEQEILSVDGCQYTYDELTNFSASLRTAIIERTAPGDVIVSLAALYLTCYVSVYASITSGRILTPLDVTHPISRNKKCIELSDAKLLIVSETYLELARQLSEDKIPILVIEQEFCNPSTSAVEVSAEVPAAYIFTSGTTGEPKAVIKRQGDFAHAIYRFSRARRFVSTDIEHFPGSPAHVGAINDILMNLLNGHLGIPIDVADLNPNEFVRKLIKEKATLTNLGPSFFRAILPILKECKKELNLREILSTGAPLLRSDVAHFFSGEFNDIHLCQNYGSTETGPICYGRYTKNDGIGLKPLPLTIPHPDCSFSLAKENGEKVLVNENGLLVVHSKYVAQGYLNATPKDQSNFYIDQDTGIPSFRIGERGYIDETGALYITGRSDRQISVYGRRFEVGEIENALLHHPGVAEVHLPAIQDGKTLHAAISLRDGFQVEKSELRQFLRTLIPEAAIPRKFTFLQELPKTNSGKIDTFAVDQIMEKKSTVQVSGHGGKPQCSVEGWIADCWQEVLGIERPGRQERFEDLGGDSLAAMQLALLIEKYTSAKVGIDALLMKGSIAEQAENLESLGEDKQPLLLPLKLSERGPRLLFVPGLRGHAWNYSPLVQLLTSEVQVEGLSIDAVLSRTGNSVGRADITEVIVKEILRDNQGRKLWIGGYSLGGTIACDVANKLVEAGQSPEKVVLIDPDRAKKMTFKNYLKAQLSLPKRTWLNWKRKNQVVKTIEMRTMLSAKTLRKIYHGPLALPKVPVALLLTKGMKETMLEVFGVTKDEMKYLNPTFINHGHLDLLRPPYVSDTASWLDGELIRVPQKGLS